ncbi:flagellar biosynthetic protein FliR [Nocardioides yefusunii]|uniref:Flagellar biosynthetic protein FliR n=1 Tax=Nocardioides yefusunii TaxID=2500546 RepID=A0ABW1QZK7_9ACTN|nr:flagellar biosynthetic protein FliR [Nocardioides yefusunii]
MTITVNGLELLAYLLASLRIVAWLSVVPPFSTSSIPSMGKVVLALGLSFAVGPQLAGQVPTDSWELLVVALTQVAIGLAMGFLTFLLFQAIPIAGALIDVMGGFATTQAWDPMAMNTNTVFGKFHQQIATVLLFVSGGHLLVIGGLLKSFTLVPLGEIPDLDGAADVFSIAFSLMFTTAVQIALPMLAVLFVTDLALALLTKVAPQLNALNVMYAAKIGLVLLLIGMSFPVLPEALSRIVDLANEASSTLLGGR